MSLPLITQQVVSRLLVLLVTTGVISACDLAYRMLAPPGVEFVAPPAGNYEDPDAYKVVAAVYPQYRAKYIFSPPPPRKGNWTSRNTMVNITPEDTWYVTHRIGGRLAIFSEAYQSRQRKFLSTADRFASPYLYHLLIDDDGTVNRGWLLLENPRAVVAALDRYQNLDPELRSTTGWPVAPLFESVPHK